MTGIAGINVEPDRQYNENGDIVLGAMEPAYSDEGADDNAVAGIESSPTYGRNRPN
jgi:hypothetical protein